MKKLYFWMMEKARHQYAVRWLALLSFLESSVFPIPTDIMLMPMVLANRAKAWYYATVTTVSSVAGAVLGYIIGAFFFDTFGQSILSFYGYETAFDQAKTYYADYGILIVLIGGLTPIPFKVITIASGVFSLNPIVFILSAIAARAPRFFIEAGLLWKFGEPINNFIEKRLTLVLSLFALLIVGGFIAIKYLG